MKDKKIRACIRCGSKRLEEVEKIAPGLARFGITVLGGFLRCLNCGNIGVPIEFDNERSYEKFLKELKKKK